MFAVKFFSTAINCYSGGVDGIKVWAWSEITSSSSCQPKASLVAKEVRRQDYEINSMTVGNVSCGM